MSATWYFCRSCGHRGLFVAGEEEVVPCPQCHDHGRDEAIMRRQDVEWAKRTQVDEDTGKEVRGNG